MSTLELPGYLDASHFRREGERASLVLETAAGLTPQGMVAHPVFFSGAVRRPDVAAAGLRCLVEIASTRYFNPSPVALASLDPIMTAQGDRLRCEAFSACNGVYARLDLLGDNLDQRVSGAIGFGTTNVDINPPLFLALAGIGRSDTLHLHVGPERTHFDVGKTRHTERKVALPERWVRALAETQCLAATLQLRGQLDGAAWLRVAQSLSMGGGSGAGSTLWLVPSPGGLRQTARPVAGAVPLAGSARLASMRRLHHLLHEVRIYAPEVDATTQAAASAWVFELPGARLTLMLSPEAWRGFSGEGAVLGSLGRAQSTDAQTLASLLAWESCIDTVALSNEAQMSPARVADGLTALAIHGQVGFDLHEQSYFHRQLPYHEDRLQLNYPRLAAARKLLVEGAVTQVDGHYRVRGDHGHYRVTPIDGRLQCTCLFEAKYQGSRGPCKHALAVQLMQT